MAICRLRIITGTVLMLVFACPGLSRAACVPTDLAKPAPRDPVAQVLAQQKVCPEDAIEFREALKKAGARLEPTMVNFHGFHKPNDGAFFFFEIVSGAISTPPSSLAIQRGDLLFGHFTATNGGTLVSDKDGQLVIELIAWDPDKQFYNFYELFDGMWSYRGDSKDILDDIQLLYRARTGSQRPFRQRLRCSGCHINGGLLQKELTPPHNDWFVKARTLPLGTLKPDAAVKAIIADVVDAGELTKLVTASARRLADSPGYRKVLAARSMQERLRPLFCAVELNIESDADLFDDKKPALQVPSAFFVDQRLATAGITVPRQHYDAALLKLHASLPKTPNRVDADHAWLTPVKAQSDIVAVSALIEQSTIDKEFAEDVLAVDFTNPLYSASRCGLLKLVPNDGGSGFVSRFQDALRSAKTPAATELLGNLTDPKQTATSHEARALAFLATCKQRATDPAAVQGWANLLAQRRIEVSASEVSRHGEGHILENPNRVVFPATQPAAVAGRLTLTPDCQVR